MSLKNNLLNSRVIICCGSGGVGKTTISAALGLMAAELGRKVVVITIDPAKRLATSLGLKELKTTPTDLTDQIPEKMGTGRFSAVMPDTRHTFETFVHHMAGKNEGLAARVFKTSIFKVFAKEFSGANEYMAMEKLYELYNDPSFDLVILDTPPAANVKSFLEAPKVLSEFFDDKIIKMLAIPTSAFFGSKLISGTIRKFLEILENLTGSGFISDLIEFSTSLLELRQQFLHNLSSIQKLFEQKETHFLLVTSPERINENENFEFIKDLKSKKYFFWGFIVNRVSSLKLGFPLEDLYQNQKTTEDWIKKSKEELSKKLDPSDVQILEKAFEYWNLRMAKDLKVTQHIHQKYPEQELFLVPEQEEDVHSIESLNRISKLFHEKKT